jgi:hypothetical protein
VSGVSRSVAEGARRPGSAHAAKPVSATRTRMAPSPEAVSSASPKSGRAASAPMTRVPRPWCPDAARGDDEHASSALSRTKATPVSPTCTSATRRSTQRRVRTAKRDELAVEGDPGGDGGFADWSQGSGVRLISPSTPSSPNSSPA